MNKKFFKNKLFIVLAFVLVYLVGFSVSALLGSGSMPHEQFIGMVMSPFSKGAAAVKKSVSDFFAAHTQYDKLLEENEKLRTEISSLRAESDENSYLKIENENLKKLLKMADNEEKFSYKAADVVARGTDGWSKTLQLNIGTHDGVKKGDVVLSADGLVGIVTEAGLNWAKVSSLLDPNISIGVMLATTHDCGILSSTAVYGAEGLCKLSYIDGNAVLGRGDRIVTSGLGGVYPKGIPVGSVAEIVRQEDGTSYTTVVPFTDFSTVDRVYIITNFENGSVK